MWREREENAFRAKKLCVAYLEGEKKKAAKANIVIIIRPTIIIILLSVPLREKLQEKDPMRRLECPYKNLHKKFNMLLEIDLKEKIFEARDGRDCN